MKALVRGLFFASAVLLAGSVSFAQGTLTLNAVNPAAPTQTKVLIINDNGGGDIIGSYTVNGFPSEIQATFNANDLTIQIGSESSFLTKSLSGSETVYSGNLASNNATITETIKKSDKSLIDGTIGTITDLSGKTKNERRVVLHWNDKDILLKAKSGGACSGTLKSGKDILLTFNCTSSGTLVDALISNPDHTIGFLINLFVR
ncbi:MAG: hypothetical protein ABL958_16810 [Bdellovibrionia bacterium]